MGALSLRTPCPPPPPPPYEIDENTDSKNLEQSSASLHPLRSLSSAFCSAKATSLHYVQVPWPLAWLGPREPPTGIPSASPLLSSSPRVFVPHPGPVFSHCLAAHDLPSFPLPLDLPFFLSASGSFGVQSSVLSWLSDPEKPTEIFLIHPTRHLEFTGLFVQSRCLFLTGLQIPRGQRWW